jgi:4-aminobutyrate aminotransferase-like enzyme
MSELPQTAPDRIDRDALIARRRRFLSPSLRTFPMFPDDPLVLVRGEGAHVFDETGRRYLDGTAQNVCISLPAGTSSKDRNLHTLQGTRQTGWRQFWCWPCHC